MAGGDRRFDVVVMGAGTAGAAAAWQFASRGRSVALVDRRPAHEAGAHWHNGLLDRHFDEAGIARPEPPERFGESVDNHMFNAYGEHVLTLRGAPTVSTDMALLGARLRDDAVAAGAELVDEARLVGVGLEGRRMTAVTLELGSGAERTTTLGADLFVDASGWRGVLRRRHPDMATWCPQVRGSELCSAVDARFEVRDRSGAQAFLERLGAAPGDTVLKLSPRGGFSTLAVSTTEDLSSVGVLVGVLADGRHGTGPSLVADLLAQQTWMGDRIEGGAGVIPLRRPYARLSAPGLALVGDAACQVFPAHGSGVGFGLLAGHVLATSVAGADDPGREDVVWRYQRDFHERHGGLLANFDVMRRMSSALGTQGVVAMTRAGLLTEDMVRGGLRQEQVLPDVPSLVGLAVRMGANPGPAATMLPYLLRAQLAGLAASRPQPEAPDLEALARWEGRVARAVGPVPV